MEHDLSDAAIVLMGHGTTLNADSSAPVLQHVAELRRRRCAAEVREAFWKQPPQIREVLAGIRVPRVLIVPMFISEGYFSDAVIPNELGFTGETKDGIRVQQVEGRTLVYCRPVGTHPSMTDVLLARAKEIVAKYPFPRAPLPKDISLFIAGHGTERNANSRKPVELQADLIRAKGLYAEVQAVFMEEDPRITDVHGLAKTKNVVVVPYFISDGLHVKEDIPVMLGAPQRIVEKRLGEGQASWRNPMETKGKLIWLSASIGNEPHMADVVLELAREGARAATCNLKPAS